MQRVFSHIGHFRGFLGSVSGCFSFRCLLSHASVSNSCLHFGHLKGLLVPDVAVLVGFPMELEGVSSPSVLKQIVFVGSC